MRRPRTALMLTLLLTAALSIRADSVLLKNGRTLDAEVLSLSGPIAVLRVNGETVRMPKSEIESIGGTERAVSTAGAAPSSSPRGDSQIRAVWVTRFEWPVKEDPRATYERILSILDTAARNGFNTVLFQVRGQCDVLYPSPFEPWSHLIGSDPGFDPLEVAIREAHRRGLALHAYVNVYPVWQWDEERNVHYPPRGTTPKHPFYTLLGRGDDWGVKTEEGQTPDPLESDRYWYFSPANPEVSAYLRRVVLDLVQRYDVDGIHLDRIRYPKQSLSYDRWTQSRLRGEGNPLRLNRQAWQCDQITRLLETMKAEINSVRPGLPLTAAVWGIYDNSRIPGYEGFSSGVDQFYQDTHGWLDLGAVDGVFPMIYWPESPTPGKPRFSTLVKDFAGETEGMRLIPGMGGGHIGDWGELSREWRVAARYGNGASIFPFEKLALHDGRFAKLFGQRPAGPARLAADRTLRGRHLLIVVTDGAGKPVTDAAIWLEGRKRPGLTSADGRAGILEVPGGVPLLLAISKSGFTPARVQTQAGRPGTTVVSVHISRL